MTLPRAHLIPSTSPGHFHLISRCIRRAWLCGYDQHSKKNYGYRRQIILDRMQDLVKSYAIEITGYAIMANHFHVAAYVDPNKPHHWTDLEVAKRWVEAYPPRVCRKNLECAKGVAIAQLQNNRAELAQRREDLGSISHFMKNLKGPLARTFNKEDGCTGAFWEGRFKSIALEDEEQLIKCLRYIDLNPHKAGIANSLDECELTSIEARIKEMHIDPEVSERPMTACYSGLGFQTQLTITLGQYISTINYELSKPPDQRIDDSIAV